MRLFSNELTTVRINVLFEQNVCTIMCNTVDHVLHNAESGDVGADAGY